MKTLLHTLILCCALGAATWLIVKGVHEQETPAPVASIQPDPAPPVQATAQQAHSEEFTARARRRVMARCRTTRVRDMAVLQVNLREAAPVELAWFDASGARILHRTPFLMPGSNQVRFNMEHVPPGIYFISAQSPEGTAYLKILKTPS